MMNERLKDNFYTVGFGVIIFEFVIFDTVYLSNNIFTSGAGFLIYLMHLAYFITMIVIGSRLEYEKRYDGIKHIVSFITVYIITLEMICVSEDILWIRWMSKNVEIALLVWSFIVMLVISLYMMRLIDIRDLSENRSAVIIILIGAIVLASIKTTEGYLLYTVNGVKWIFKFLALAIIVCELLLMMYQSVKLENKAVGILTGVFSLIVGIYIGFHIGVLGFILTDLIPVGTELGIGLLYFKFGVDLDERVYRKFSWAVVIFAELHILLFMILYIFDGSAFSAFAMAAIGIAVALRLSSVNNRLLKVSNSEDSADIKIGQENDEIM